MVSSDKDKILIKICISWTDRTRDSWLRTEFQDKVWTTSSSNRLLNKFRDTAQWTDVRVATDRDRWKHWPGERYGSESKGPAWTHNTVHEISRKRGIPKSSVVRIIRKDCGWNALRGDVRKSWLRRTALLVSCFWGSFLSLPRTSSASQMKMCSLWLQQWKNCENQLTFHRVKANKIKRDFKSSVQFSPNLDF